MLHFLLHWLGLDNASGATYLFWSGFFGDVTIFAAGFMVLWHHNCHAKGCWRLGRKVENTPYIACPKHHPAHRGEKRNVPLERIHDAHRAANP